MLSSSSMIKSWAMENLKDRSRTKPSQRPLIGRCFEHFKGGLYEITKFAKWHEGGAAVAVYRNIHTGEEWVRPLEQFDEMVEVNGQEVPRFKRRPDLEYKF